MKEPKPWLVEGETKERMKFASFGRERDLEMLERDIKDPIVKARAIRQTTAAHDLNDGFGSVEAFIDATRDAVFSATQSVRESRMVLMLRIAKYYPECLIIWDELAQSLSWSNRFTAACWLYSGIPETKSDYLFNTLRNDKSKRVREMARSRYAHRPDERGYIVFDLFDPDLFDERMRRGEVFV